MAEKQLLGPVLAELTKLSRPPRRSTIRKAKKNKSRRIRRRRSRRLRCGSCLNEVRYEETSCKTTEVLAITGMEWKPVYEPVIKDVAEWQQMHQVAYWKSRAISLEYENRMLHEHIRKAHAKRIEERGELDGVKPEVEDDGGSAAGVEEPAAANELALPPREQAGKAKREEMERLYGKMAPRIGGMETAVQLNYDFQINKHNPPYWPNLPLNL